MTGGPELASIWHIDTQSIEKLREASHSLMTSSSFAKSTKDARIIAFVSAKKNEGASACALACAASLAEHGQRTLLIDAAQNHHTSGKPGHNNPNQLDHHALPTAIDSLFLMNRENSENPEIFAEAQEWFHRIVIDAGAILNAENIAPVLRAHAVCLSVKQSRTRMADAQAALALLGKESANTIGIVLKRTDG